MSKSPLGFAEFFSAGNEGGDFADAAAAGSSDSTLATRGANTSSDSTSSKSKSKSSSNGASPKSKSSSNGASSNDTSKKGNGAQTGGRKRRQRHKTRKKRGEKRRRHKRKSMPDKGWAKLAPFGRARTVMLRNCGKKCFLGPKKSFPICAKGTCKRNRKGIEAAYVRARQWGKKRSSYKSKGKYVTYRGKKGTRRVWMKGSRPRHRRSTYTRVARRAKALLRHKRR